MLKICVLRSVFGSQQIEKTGEFLYTFPVCVLPLPFNVVPMRKMYFHPWTYIEKLPLLKVMVSMV